MAAPLHHVQCAITPATRVAKVLSYLVVIGVLTVLTSETLSEYIVWFASARNTASENTAALSAENESRSAPVSCSHTVAPASTVASLTLHAQSVIA